MTGPLTEAEGRALTALAVSTVHGRLLGTDSAPTEPAAGPLRSPGASFVTLERNGRLRGCIGTLVAVRPLYRDVARNAVRAMRDPRLPPVDRQDWPELDVSVSVLTEPEPVDADERATLLAALRPGEDGLLLTDRYHRATFLPAVWEKLPDPDRFLDHLLAKGGWPPGTWPADLTASRYRSAEYTDRAPRGELTE
jgi:AmmeMemoRadiSam system protein A